MDTPYEHLQFRLLAQKAEIRNLQAENKRLRECGQELVDLVDDHIYNGLVLDTFTTQPMRRALAGEGENA